MPFRTANSSSHRKVTNGLVPAAGLALLFAPMILSGTESEPWDRVPPPAAPLFTRNLTLGGADEWQFTPNGHAKTMVEVYRNPDFGLGGFSEDSWLHQRVQLGFAVDYQDRFEWFTEFTWGALTGKEQPPAPPDRDDPDLLQLYLQGRLDLNDSQQLVARVGRQILYYGSGRLLAHREGANQRLTHDAARVSWRDREARWQVDALVASPVRVNPNAFDNRSDFDDVLLWGIYAVGPALWHEHDHAGTDIYYLGLRAVDSLLAGPGNTELRHTLGTRWWNKSAPWIYNTELIFQFGDCAGRTIVAGAASLGGGYVWDFDSWKLTLGFKGDVISGGGPTGNVNTFNPLFQANNYFNEGGYVSPANLYNLNPLVTIEPLPEVSVTAGVNWLWRFSADDFVYGPPFSRVAPPAPDGERFLGTAVNLSTSWSPHPALELVAGYTHHFVGDSLTAVGGRDVDYFQTTLRLQF